MPPVTAADNHIQENLDLPSVNTRVRIRCGGYRDYTGKVTEVYWRNNIPVIEVLTDSHIPLVYGPLQVEVVEA